jgi:hypothetical protein
MRISSGLVVLCLAALGLTSAGCQRGGRPGHAKAPSTVPSDGYAEVTGEGFVTELPAPARWREVELKSADAASHTYLGQSDATPAMVYMVHSKRVDALDPDTVAVGPQKIIRAFAAGVAQSMGCSPDELHFEPGKNAGSSGFRVGYAFSFNCSGKDRAGVGVGLVGDTHWIIQFVSATHQGLQDTPFETIEPFFGIRAR